MAGSNPSSYSSSSGAVVHSEGQTVISYGLLFEGMENGTVNRDFNAEVSESNGFLCTIS